MTNPVQWKAYGYPTASQDGAGNWHAGPPDSVVTGTWGTFRIEVGAVWDVTANPPTKTTPGTDITTINGVPTLIDSLSFGEPMGELTGQISLSELAPFDAAAWLKTGTTVDIWHVVSGTDHPYWHGFVASIETSDAPGLSVSVSLQLMGALFGEVSMRAHQPQMFDESRDIGSSIGAALNVLAYSRPLPPFTQFYFESDTTGIETRHRGSRGQMVADYLDEMLGLAQDSGGQWTISRAYAGSPTYPQARKYTLRLKSDELAGAVQQNTVFAGGYGVALSLTCDMTEQPNAIYGEGLGSDGNRWRNAKYPMLTPSAPVYPDRVIGSDYPLVEGDEDADFTTDVVTQMQAQLRAGGWPDVQITGVFDTDTTTALLFLQADAGVTVTGTVTNNAGWNLIWSHGTGTTDLSSGYFRPLGEVKESQPYTFASDGDVTGNNNTGAHPYDGRIRVERVISFADKINKSRATTYATRLVNQATAPGWTGTLTLTSDPTDETSAGRSRLDIREGSWIRVNNLAGGTHLDFYIAGITQSPETEGFPTTLTVSEIPWDLLDLSTRLERAREAKEDPAKSFYSLRTRTARPWRDAVGWDAESGAGIIRPMALSAGWNVVKIVGAQRGQIGAANLRTYSPASKFAFAIFGAEVTTGDLDGWVADPLAEYTAALGDSWWNVDSIQSALTAHGFIEAWGEFGEGAGYWPGKESTDPPHSVTGKMIDAMSWEFVSADPPFLWAAIWATETTRFTGTFRVIIQE